MPHMGALIVEFGLGHEPATSLAECGGKAVNLVKLAAAGLPVPPGSVLTTDAYRTFVEANGLGAVIEAALSGLDPAIADRLEQASAHIRAAFAAGSVPAEVQEAVRGAAAVSGGKPVAVRSSATAEDLPELSFAGQQDTYLNVIGADAVLRAVVDCWSSLWTARAIGYRERAGIAHDGTALAVVVQELVPAEIAGVMFTADPVDGRRDRVVIDATYGLGEALVSGLVEPDHYVVADGGQVVERTAGRKAVATVARAGGGVDTIDTDHRELTLDDRQLIELAAMGRRVEALAGMPQDIEWAYAAGRLWLLQSRAVTSLYPLPDPKGRDGGLGWEGFGAWLSFGGFQGMLEPITPLGQDALILLARGLTRLFGGKTGSGGLTSVPFLRFAGERLWVRVDHALRTPVGRKALPAVLSIADPASGHLVAALDEPRLHPAQARSRPLRLMKAGLPILRAMMQAVPILVRDPAALRRRLEHECDHLVQSAAIREQEAALQPAGEPRLRARLDAMTVSLEAAFGTLLPRFAPIMLPSAITQRRLVTLGGPGALTALRSLEGNITTEMDLDLWRVATVIRADPLVSARFAAGSPDELARDYQAGVFPASVQTAIASFLDRWGIRGVGEIDLGHPRWADQPAGVMASLTSYTALPESAITPDTAFAQGRQKAVAALQTLSRDLRRRGWRGRLDASQASFLVSRVRATFGARETPKFTLIRLFGVVRAGLLASGEELVAAGRLERADDVFQLHLDQLRCAWSTEPAVLRALVNDSRATALREARRRQIPRVILGDGRTFYEGVTDPGDGSLGGSPVSPGVAEGQIRVVDSPTNAGLLPGEILVCAGTDPAWTPLFLVAAGLITEVGGMMTHGSVVAREYGIPAVVGVHDATTRLRTGMRVRLDGSSGTITILDDAGQPTAPD